MVASTVLNEFGKPFEKEMPNWSDDRREMIKAHYDSARADSNMLGDLWANADRLSPDNANRLSVRRALRQRSRYECIENNSYLIGTIRMIVNDMVGSGPKLEITDRRIPKEQQRRIETQFVRWSKAINYREKLMQMRTDKIVTGEAFKLSYTNRKVRHSVQLDFRVLEADRFTTEYFAPEIYDYGRIRYVDGIEYDRYENPRRYYMLKSHPGGYWYQGNPLEGNWINAIDIRHWFRKDRSWHRGVPELTPSLPLCSLLRRYTLAVVLAAETAADFAAVLQSEAPPGATTKYNDNPFDVFPIEKGLFTTLPWGYTMEQMRPEQPITHYDEFVAALIREIIHPLMVPFNLHSGSSAGSNMSSASVDVDVYKRMQNSERLSMESNVLDEDCWQWWQEAALVDGYLGGEDLSEFMHELPDHVWRWDLVSQDHSDPAKVANALKTLHDKGFITDRDIQARFNRGLEDWQEEIKDQTKFRISLGLSLPPPDGESAEGDQRTGKQPSKKEDAEEEDLVTAS